MVIEEVGNESKSGEVVLVDPLSDSTLCKVRDDWAETGGDRARDTISAQREGGSW